MKIAKFTQVVFFHVFDYVISQISALILQLVLILNSLNRRVVASKTIS